MSITEYARHRGCALRAVQFAVEKHRITRNPDGTIDSEQADRDWAANTETSKPRGPKPRTGITKPLRGPVPVTSPEDIDNPTGVTYASARAERERYEAKLKRLQFEERQGDLLPRVEVEAKTTKMFQVFRDALLNVPNRIAGQLAAETDPRLIHELLEAEIQQALQEFAGAEVADDAAA
jgi:hypothetical protein